MKTILVTGGTGAVGPRIVEALVAEGYAVRLLALDAPRSGTLPAGVELRVGSITDPDVVREAIQGCEGVIHMAALLHIVNPAPALRAKYEAINVGGTRTVLEAAQMARVQRVVFFSTIAVYGYGGRGCQTEILNETSACRPDTFYGETKLAAEKLVLEARRTDGASLGTVLRMGAIYDRVSRAITKSWRWRWQSTVSFLLGADRTAARWSMTGMSRRRQFLRYGCRKRRGRCIM